MIKNRDTEGTIRQRPNGMWEARFTAGYKPDGKQVQKSVYGATEREVQRKLRSALVDVERGEVGTATGSVGEWLEEWMLKYKQRALKPQTYAQYRRIVDQHIIPAIGHLALSKVNVRQMQRYINTLSDEDARKDGREGGLSKAYIEKIRNILHDAFDQALINGEINRNPIVGIVLPKEEPSEMRVLSMEEQERFVDALSEERLRPFFLLALSTGMRRGELLGLTWDCVDFRKNEILVKQAATRYKDPVTGQPVHELTSPKTFNSRRRIPIVNSLIPVLKQHMNEQRLLAVSPSWNPQDLVFCSSNGTIIEANTINRTLARITKKAEIEQFSMHALRHTFATRMLEQGVSPKVVQELLGHTDVTLTLNTYSHVMPSTAHREMEKLDSLFSTQETPSVCRSGRRNPAIR